MDLTTKKTIQASRGFTWTYYVSPAKDNKPTLLLCHGFPDDASEWSGLISHLVPAGYGVIAPDMLGYAGTSKPTDPAAFKWSLMVKDVTEILDAESASTVIPLGHDWGSSFVQAFRNLAPKRCSGLALINVGYNLGTRSGDFDLDAVLKMTEQTFGYGLFWYWKLFTAPDGAKVMNEHVDRVADLMHAPADVWRKTMCEPEQTRKVITGTEPIPRQAYATEEMKQKFVERLTRDGFDAPLCWYKATVEGHQRKEIDQDNLVVDVPVLYVGYKQDVVCRTEMNAKAAADGFLPKCTTVLYDGTHWALLEKPDEFAKTVVGWLEKTF